MSELPTLERCDGCRYWYPVDTDEEYKSFDLITVAGGSESGSYPLCNHGHCRRYPPVLDPRKKSRSAMEFRFAEIYYDEWCGEFVPQVPPPTA